MGGRAASDLKVWIPQFSRTSEVAGVAGSSPTCNGASILASSPFGIIVIPAKPRAAYIAVVRIGGNCDSQMQTDLSGIHSNFAGCRFPGDPNSLSVPARSRITVPGEVDSTLGEKAYAQSSKAT